MRSKIRTTFLVHEYLSRLADVSWPVRSQRLPQHLVVLAFVSATRADRQTVVIVSQNVQLPSNRHTKDVHHNRHAHPMIIFQEMLILSVFGLQTRKPKPIT